MTRKVYWTVRDVADLQGWTYKRAWLWLRRGQALETKSGRLVVTRRRLKEIFPELLEELEMQRLEDDLGEFVD